MNILVSKLIKELSTIPCIEAILLGGSRATSSEDKNSDVDLYVYSFTNVPLENRKDITKKFFNYIELKNTYWEEEDDGYLLDNTPVEIIYRNIDSFENSLKNTILNCEPSIGYSTCFWSNIINSKILYDKNKILQEIKYKYNIPYPSKLKENIIKINYNLLKEKMPNYYNQIKKAINRNDVISINHRVCALLASYFDIIFAYNEFLHPGEKKILKIIKNNNLIVPDNMEQNVLTLLSLSGTNNLELLKQLDTLVYNLKLKYNL